MYDPVCCPRWICCLKFRQFESITIIPTVRLSVTYPPLLLHRPPDTALQEYHLAPHDFLYELAQFGGTVTGPKTLGLRCLWIIFLGDLPDLTSNSN